MNFNELNTEVTKALLISIVNRHYSFRDLVSVAKGTNTIGWTEQDTGFRTLRIDAAGVVEIRIKRCKSLFVQDHVHLDIESSTLKFKGKLRINDFRPQR